GTLSGKIDAGNHINKILAGPNDNSLLVCSKQNKSTQVISFVIKKQIDTTGSPFMGKKDAPVEVVVFSDFQCPYCSEVAPVIKELFEFNKENIKIVYKNFPLTSIHKLAFKAATSALAAMELELGNSSGSSDGNGNVNGIINGNGNGKFWEFHDRLFEQFNTMTDESILQIAVDLGFDKKIFEEKMKDPKLSQMIQKDMQDAQKADVNSVPTIFINGKLQDQRSIQALQMNIDRELSKKNNTK
ncbi:MAG: thioredoxin domain-containing protein, partial [Desulfamplus sp.]|nr:thioredoxin domain-containing protein [Desulfamplus sp.]